MNTKRLLFWLGFVVVLGFIIWGLIVAMNKPPRSGPKLGAPAPVSTTDHVRGPVDAPVTLIEYSDFQCPACEAYYPVIEQLIASSTVPVRMVYRHFPLPQHANAMPAAMATEAAGAQGKFWDMYHIIFSKHADWTELTDATAIFIGYATDLGLDIPRFKADLSSSTLKDHITADQDDGVRIGIDSTPTLFLNGKAITNPQSYAEFQTRIQDASSGGSR